MRRSVAQKSTRFLHSTQIHQCDENYEKMQSSTRAGQPLKGCPEMLSNGRDAGGSRDRNRQHVIDEQSPGCYQPSVCPEVFRQLCRHRHRKGTHVLSVCSWRRRWQEDGYAD